MVVANAVFRPAFPHRFAAKNFEALFKPKNRFLIFFRRAGAPARIRA
jgi:hypothetical protein